MASNFIPQFYSDYQFSPDEFSEITSVMGRENCYGGTAATFASTISSGAVFRGPSATMLGDSNDFPILFNNHVNSSNFSPESDVMSPVQTVPFPERLGVWSDMVVPALMQDYNNNNDNNMGLVSGIARTQSFGGFAREFVEEYCCGGTLLSNSNPVCPSSAENWGIQCNRMPASEQPNMKVGRYTMEERKDRIVRYLKKRNQRNFNKTIKYACRKTLADRRVRVRGRFARNNELCEEETEAKKTEISHQEKESYCNDNFQIKNDVDDDDDDEWLEEAVASLMYVPYIAG